MLSACCIPSPDYRLGKPGTPTLLGQGFQPPSDVRHSWPGRSGPGSRACEEKQAVHNAPLASPADPQVPRLHAQAHPPRPACAHTHRTSLQLSPSQRPTTRTTGEPAAHPPPLPPASDHTRGRREASLGLCPFQF